jgi:hypothetical protein
MTQHEHVGGGSSNVAIVALIVLVILAVVAVLAFGGFTWLRNLVGGGGRVEPTAQPGPTEVAPTAPPPASYWSPGGAAAVLG